MDGIISQEWPQIIFPFVAKLITLKLHERTSLTYILFSIFQTVVSLNWKMSFWKYPVIINTGIATQSDEQLTLTKKVSPQTVWFPQSTVGYTTKQVQHSRAVIVLACLIKPKTQSQIIGINSLLTQVFSFRINMRSQTGVYFSHNKSIWALPTSIREIIRETDGKNFFKLTLKRKWSTV